MSYKKIETDNQWEITIKYRIQKGIRNQIY